MIWTAIFVVFARNGLKNRFRNYSKQPYTFYHIGERGVPKHVWVWTWGQLDSSTPCSGWNVETERVTTNSTIIFVYPPKKVSKAAFLSLCNFLFSQNSYITCINYGSYKDPYIIKVKTLWESHKICKNLPLVFVLIKRQNN